MRKTIGLIFIIATSCQDATGNKGVDENSSTTAGQATRLVGGKNVAVSRKDKHLQARIERLEKEARSRGWNIKKDFLVTSNEDYVTFLDYLLSDGRVVKTGEVNVYVSNRFEVYVGKGFVDIDRNASIDDVIRFLTE